MYSNSRKLKNIQESNLRLEKRYLMEQAPPPAPPAPSTPPTTGSTPTDRKEIIPMVKNPGPKSMKNKKDGTVKKWDELNPQQQLTVAKKCGHQTVDEYKKDNEWKCKVDDKK